MKTLVLTVSLILSAVPAYPCGWYLMCHPFPVGKLHRLSIGGVGGFEGQRRRAFDTAAECEQFPERAYFAYLDAGGALHYAKTTKDIDGATEDVVAFACSCEAAK